METKGFSADFQRHEKKYMLTRTQWERLADRIAPQMAQDAYGRYTICSVYYDTPDFRLIRASLDKPVYKEKLRLRSYGVPGREDTVFLELKKKLQGVTYKRRIALPLREATAYLAHGEPPAQDGQILGEIDCFVRRHPLSPRALLCYDRIALCGRRDPGLRLTVDANLRFRDWDLDLSLGDHGLPLLGREHCLMEIKTPGVLPLWLSEQLSALRIYPCSFSKYGAAYTEHLVDGLARRPAHREVLSHAG